MNKDFDKWNEKKKILEKRSSDFLFHSGEIWWCSVGLNIAMESCGKGIEFQRPVLVLKKLSRTIFIGIPLSSKKKIGSWFIDITIHGEKRFALLYQIRMFSTNRFQRRLAALDDNDFSRIKEKLEALLELSNHHQDVSPGSVGNPKSTITIDKSDVKVNKPSYEERLVEIRKMHSEAYKPWSDEDDKLLKEKFQSGEKVPGLSALFKRRPSAIRSRLKKLGLR